MNRGRFVLESVCMCVRNMQSKKEVKVMNLKKEKSKGREPVRSGVSGQQPDHNWFKERFGHTPDNKGVIASPPKEQLTDKK